VWLAALPPTADVVQPLSSSLKGDKEKEKEKENLGGDFPHLIIFLFLFLFLFPEGRRRSRPM
jgi:hypothetical protein